MSILKSLSSLGQVSTSSISKSSIAGGQQQSSIQTGNQTALLDLCLDLHVRGIICADVNLDLHV